MKTFQQIGTDAGALVTEKNRAYGSSFATAGAAMQLLYPNGIAPGQMRDALVLVRIWDKLMRIATDRDALGESPYNDIIGYGILGVAMHQHGEGGTTTPCASVSEKVAASESQEPSASATPSALAPTTPSANAPSAPSSPLPSTPPSAPASASSAASVPTATDVAAKEESVDENSIADQRLEHIHWMIPSNTFSNAEAKRNLQEASAGLAAAAASLEKCEVLR